MKRSTLTDAEIEGYMNFDAVLAKATVRSGFTKWVVYSAAIITIGVLVGVSVWLSTSDSMPVVPTNPNQVNEATSQAQPDNIEPSSVVIDSVKNVQSEKPAPALARKREQEQPQPEPESAPAFTGYRQAEPVGGYEKLYSYFNETIQYPAAALRDSVQGVVVVAFVINKSGKAEQIQVEQSLRADCDKEAMRVIESMEPWLPALLNGKPVATKISVPLSFQILHAK